MHDRVTKHKGYKHQEFHQYSVRLVYTLSAPLPDGISRVKTVRHKVRNGVETPTNLKDITVTSFVHSCYVTDIYHLTGTTHKELTQKGIE